MQFTYDAYRSLLMLLQSHGYEFTDYHEWRKFSRCVILRHDLDFDISRAVKIAKIEADVGARSTYFVLVHSDAYNALSFRNVKILKQVLHYGHDIGLHFDEMSYPEWNGDKEKICIFIREEATVLGRAIGKAVSSVSMHRPSADILGEDLKIPGIVNSYGNTFFHEFKYLSDSRRHWREPVEATIANENYERLQILTHPFWYSEQERGLRVALMDFVNQANYDRYVMLQENFTNLDEVLVEADVAGVHPSKNTGERFL